MAGQVVGIQHRGFEPVEHTLEECSLLVVDWTEQGSIVVVEHGCFEFGVGLVVGDKPNHSNCSVECAPQLDFVGYTLRVGGNFDM